MLQPLQAYLLQPYVIHYKNAINLNDEQNFPLIFIELSYRRFLCP